MKKILIALQLVCASGVVLAKLPALGDEAKAKAAEAAAKSAWSGKMDNYLLCKSQDKVAASYFKTAKDAKPAAATPPCADPGVFVYVPPEPAKPVEAAGAHSPTATAASPPGSKAPDAAVNPAPAAAKKI